MNKAKEQLVATVANKLPTHLREEWAKELLDAITATGWRVVYAPDGLGTGGASKGFEEWHASE